MWQSASNIYNSINISNISSILDIEGLKHFEPLFRLFSECFKRLISGDFSFLLDDLILAVFFGGFCVLLWHFLVLLYPIAKDVVWNRGPGGRFLYRSRTIPNNTQNNNPINPLLEQIQHLDMSIGTDGLQMDRSWR